METRKPSDYHNSNIQAPTTRLGSASGSTNLFRSRLEKNSTVTNFKRTEVSPYKESTNHNPLDDGFTMVVDERNRSLKRTPTVLKRSEYKTETVRHAEDYHRQK